MDGFTGHCFFQGETTDSFSLLFPFYYTFIYRDIFMWLWISIILHTNLDPKSLFGQKHSFLTFQKRTSIFPLYFRGYAIYLIMNMENRLDSYKQACACLVLLIILQSVDCNCLFSQAEVMKMELNSNVNVHYIMTST